MKSLSYGSSHKFHIYKGEIKKCSGKLFRHHIGGTSTYYFKNWPFLIKTHFASTWYCKSSNNPNQIVFRVQVQFLVRMKLEQLKGGTLIQFTINDLRIVLHISERHRNFLTQLCFSLQCSRHIPSILWKSTVKIFK